MLLPGPQTGCFPAGGRHQPLLPPTAITKILRSPHQDHVCYLSWHMLFLRLLGKHFSFQALFKCITSLKLALCLPGKFQSIISLLFTVVSGLFIALLSSQSVFMLYSICYLNLFPKLNWTSLRAQLILYSCHWVPQNSLQ